MCGIFGCVLKEGRAAPLVLAALKRLEYRGYDSCGEATVHEGRLFIKKDVGEVDAVHAKLKLDDLPGRIGMGHTRWATHGAPTRENAHPHTDCTGRIAVVHNGIIENFMELREELRARGHVFRSKTDTEVVPHLVEEYMAEGMGFVEAVMHAVRRLRGSFALVVMHVDFDGLVCVKMESPLVLGVGRDGMYVASDVPAFLPYTNVVVTLEDGDLAVVRADGYEIYRFATGRPVKRKPRVIDWTADMAEKEGYPHFMIKEIHEQPKCLKNTLRLPRRYLEMMADLLGSAREAFMVACGTSYHACVAASYAMAKLAKKAVHPVIASEFIENYGDFVGPRTTVLAVSQSGETADTLAAVEHARARGATILGITNVLGSKLTRVARVYVCQQSGPEIGVAATKTYTAQLSVLSQLTILMAERRGKIGHAEAEELWGWMEKVPDLVGAVIEATEKEVMRLAERYAGVQKFAFMGTGINLATALEGRLKLLEIAYAPSIATSDLDELIMECLGHGSVAIFICPSRGNCREPVLDRALAASDNGLTTIMLAQEGDSEAKEVCHEFLALPVPPDMPEVLTPLPFIVPLQMFAYYVSVRRGLNPDKPRNLAKSVTVK